MLIFFNSSVSTEAGSIGTLVNNITAAYTLEGSPQIVFDGDEINLEHMFPKWIVEQYKTDPENSPVIDWFKYYYRWLMSKDGYGCGFYLEGLRDFLNIPDEFLQGVADLYFPLLDFSEYPELKDGFRKFMVNSKLNYFDQRGTTEGIKYAITTLFDGTSAGTTVATNGAGIIEITTDMSSEYNDLLESSCCPYSFIITITNT